MCLKTEGCTYRRPPQRAFLSTSSCFTFGDPCIYPQTLALFHFYFTSSRGEGNRNRSDECLVFFAECFKRGSCCLPWRPVAVELPSRHRVLPAWRELLTDSIPATTCATAACRPRRDFAILSGGRCPSGFVVAAASLGTEGPRPHRSYPLDVRRLPKRDGGPCY